MVAVASQRVPAKTILALRIVVQNVSIAQLIVMGIRLAIVKDSVRMAVVANRLVLVRMTRVQHTVVLSA